MWYIQVNLVDEVLFTIHSCSGYLQIIFYVSTNDAAGTILHT